MALSKRQINNLLRMKSITGEWPWSTNDEATIDQHIKDIVAEVRRKVRLTEKTEYDHYGSGYASFVDCWLYRPNDEFRFHAGDAYWGLVVLFSRLSKYYVVGKGQKTWDGNRGSSYLPCFEFVDQISQPAVTAIVGKVCRVLDGRGLERLNSDELSELLPGDIQIPTILGGPPWRHFDALFHWED